MRNARCIKVGVGGLLAFGVLGLTAAAATEPQGNRLVTRVVGEAPQIGQEAHAKQGEVIYRQFDYDSLHAIRLLADVSVDKKVLRAGDVLQGYDTGKRKDGQRFCKEVHEADSKGQPLTTLCCLVRAASGEPFTLTWSRRPKWTTGRKRDKLKGVVEYEPVAIPVPARPGVEGDSTYSYEILFQGAAGGVLRLLYREFVNDLARPSFSQELTYDYASGASTTVSVKEAEIAIQRAGNDGIDYVIVKGLARRR
jgi:hypothetical protein